MEKGIEHGISLVEKIRRVKKKLLFDGKKGNYSGQPLRFGKA
jgi:hypothetical protein